MSIVVVDFKLDFPAEKIIAAMSRPQWLLQMHPFVKEHESGREPPPGVLGHKDKVVYYSGITADRVVCKTDANDMAVKVEVSIGGQLIAKAVTAMAFTNTTAGCDCRFSIERDKPFAEEEIALQKDYLEKTMQGFSYYVNTGKPVLKNQFGSHPYYSP